eukprot:scaffold221630_cov30-Tisochrysis_lutea.AAC.6
MASDSSTPGTPASSRRSSRPEAVGCVMAPVLQRKSDNTSRLRAGGGSIATSMPRFRIARGSPGGAAHVSPLPRLAGPLPATAIARHARTVG